MNIWVILWIVLSSILIGIFIWSNKALIDQKKAWKRFAERNKLKYFPNSFLKSPVVSKKFKSTKFRLFSEEQLTNDMTRRRFTTVMEWMMPGMPTNGIIASEEMKDIVDLANVNDRIKKPRGQWSSKDFIVAEDADVLMPYLTRERLDAMQRIIKIKNGRFIFAFDTNQGVLRLETNDPLLEADKITPIYDKVKEYVDKLIPTETDFKECEKIKAQKQPEETAAAEEEEIEQDSETQTLKEPEVDLQAEGRKSNESGADEG
mgnify:CR=1 FL=1